MHEVFINGRHRKVEATWNDFSRARLLQLVPLLYEPARDVVALQLRLLCFLLGLSPAFFAFRLTPVQMTQLVWMTDFLLSESIGLTAQLLPWVRRPRTWRRPLPRKWWGPRASLRNLRFGEFVFADGYFVAYATRQDAGALDKLLAVLYRPQRRGYRPHAADYGGDRREEFNEHLVARRAAQLAGLPEAEKLAVLTWYRGCRDELTEHFPLVFTPAEEAGTATTSWGQVLLELSGGAFGPLDDTARQPARTILAKMEADARRAKELERRAKEQSRTTA
ncbi:hypothetical protein [Hymenobacter terricola]|uniref:hypothetical protein n=1 Tax=Hymenobacter terricola TaxID=2819236 RepID=UPI001B311840|nr:hypothetical protein [Hymenobacter terricola]